MILPHFGQAIDSWNNLERAKCSVGASLEQLHSYYVLWTFPLGLVARHLTPPRIAVGAPSPLNLSVTVVGLGGSTEVLGQIWTNGPNKLNLGKFSEPKETNK